MSHRPITAKKIAKLRKALRRTPPTFIDLVHYLQLHGHADNAGQARKIILAHRVKSESHVLGIVKLPVLTPAGKVEVQEVVNPHVPSSLRATLRVLPEADTA